MSENFTRREQLKTNFKINLLFSILWANPQGVTRAQMSQISGDGYIGFYIAIFSSRDNGDHTSLRQTLSYSSYLLTETLGYNNKSETSRTWVKNSRFQDRNKCTKNETARLFVKDAEISRLDEKFATPLSG